jgi:hypothetical protein
MILNFCVVRNSVKEEDRAMPEPELKKTEQRLAEVLAASAISEL